MRRCASRSRSRSRSCCSCWRWSCPFEAARPAGCCAMPLAAATTLVVALKAGELAIRSTLGRPLNPLLDLDLAPSLVHLLAGTLGAWRTGLLLAGAALALLLVLGLSVVAIGIAQRALAGPRPRALMLALGILLLAALRSRPDSTAPGDLAAGLGARQRHAAGAMAARPRCGPRPGQARGGHGIRPVSRPAGRRPADAAGWHRRAADLCRILWTQRARAAALCSDHRNRGWRRSSGRSRRAGSSRHRATSRRPRWAASPGSRTARSRAASGCRISATTTPWCEAIG